MTETPSTKSDQEPDAFAHGPVYLALRRFVRNSAPFLIRPWTALKRIVWSVRFRSAESRFKQIHKTNYWANAESLSGDGSTLEATRKVRDALGIFVRQYEVCSLLDIPCGDFNWMKHVHLDIQYTGGDIVDELVARNQENHGTPNRTFQVLDLTKTPLPKCDLVFSRDCLNHLSIRDVQLAIDNICASGATYLGVTQFPAQQVNRNQDSGFSYRELNFCLAPFHWPQPLAQFDEQSHPGKQLWFWRVCDLPNSKGQTTAIP